MVDIAQLVRASDCGSEGRRFETDYPPQKLPLTGSFFCLVKIDSIFLVFLIPQIL